MTCSRSLSLSVEELEFEPGPHPSAHIGVQGLAVSEGELRCVVTFEPTHAHRSHGSQLPFVALGAGQSWGPSLPWQTWGDKKVLEPQTQNWKGPQRPSSGSATDLNHASSCYPCFLILLS